MYNVRGRSRRCRTKDVRLDGGRKLCLSKQLACCQRWRHVGLCTERVPRHRRCHRCSAILLEGSVCLPRILLRRVPTSPSDLETSILRDLRRRTSEVGKVYRAGVVWVQCPLMLVRIGFRSVLLLRWKRVVQFRIVSVLVRLRRRLLRNVARHLARQHRVCGRRFQ